jgi:nucleoid-associated protein EbfC
MFDIAKMMAQAKKVQDRMGSIQEELAGMEVTGKSKNGKVSVTCNGKFEFTNVVIAPDAVGNAAELQVWVLEALQDATTQILGITEGKMKELTAGINIPGLKLPF